MFKTYQFGELFRKHGEAYINNFSPTLEQIKVALASGLFSCHIYLTARIE